MRDRILKFRAWNKGHKKMHYKVNLYSMNREGVMDRAQLENKQVMEFIGGSCEVMQFIGRKDKSGTDIYEDDLVKDNDGSVWLIRYDAEDACFVFQNPKDKGNYNTLTWLFSGSYLGHDKDGNLDVKIIGNIFETPHLLNQ